MEELRTATNAGHSITLTSAYRSARHQAWIFRSRMAGTSDAALGTLLETVAAPGYSKHHTGYAIDLRSGNSVLFDFAQRPPMHGCPPITSPTPRRTDGCPPTPSASTIKAQTPNRGSLSGPAPSTSSAGFRTQRGNPFCDTLDSIFVDDVTWLHQTKITTGCTEIRFCTERAVTRAEGATFLWRLFGRSSASQPAGFDDVAEGTFYADAVAWMFENNITTGTSPLTFSPSDPLTRAQFVTLLWRAAGQPTPARPHPFEDVGADSFANDAVAWAAGEGITNGTTRTTFFL